MRKQPTQWLLSILGFLLLFAGSPAALAHPGGHAHAEPASLVETGAPPAVAVLQAASVTARGQLLGDCDCPGDHCSCTSECQALCAMSAVPVDETVLPLFPARPTFFAKHAAAGIGHRPAADPDPPRQRA